MSLNIDLATASSPGFSLFVLTIAKKAVREVRDVRDDIDVQIEQKVWGLITRPGLINNLLPEGPTNHFAALMNMLDLKTLRKNPPLVD